VLLVHPGGPFFENKDLGAWTIPKGEPLDGEELIDCAWREFVEEVGRGLVGDLVGWHGQLVVRAPQAPEGPSPASASKHPLSSLRDPDNELSGPPRLIALGSVKQRGGKTVHAWAAEGDCDPARVRSNTFTIEWPPRSGRLTEFPEIDQAQWFDLPTAREKINPAQVELLARLEERLETED
jgi:predicted NUDIX family NTP pyrophosphohydrolase